MINIITIIIIIIIIVINLLLLYTYIYNYNCRRLCFRNITVIIKGDVKSLYKNNVGQKSDIRYNN